jgi:hypothetical protein
MNDVIKKERVEQTVRNSATATYPAPAEHLREKSALLPSSKTRENINPAIFLEVVMGKSETINQLHFPSQKKKRGTCLMYPSQDARK